MSRPSGRARAGIHDRRLHRRSRRGGSSARPANLGRRLRFEPLEERRLLSITVNTLVDENDGIGDGMISLRDAIAAAMPGDTINFDPALTSGSPGTINLVGIAFGSLVINKNLTIEGPGADRLTIDGGDQSLNFSRIFTVDDGSNGTLAEVVISGLTLRDGLATGAGDAGDGGAIFSRENLTIRDSVFTNNIADDDGGAVYVDEGILTVERSTLSGNMAGGLGGGIGTLASTLEVVASTVSGNESGDGGGGIYSDGDTTIDSSTISGNSTAGFGGGVGAGNGDVFILQSTVSGNLADGGAGGVLIGFTGTAEIRHSTIVGNTADVDDDAGDFEAGGGILASNATITVYHTIVASNRDRTGQAHDVGSVISAPYDVSWSIIGDGDGGTINDLGKNQIGTSVSAINPRLAPLADNGGPTQTHALLSTSPALDSGDGALVPGMGGVPLFDQRGDPLPRVRDGNGVGGARIDIGAFEQLGPIVVDMLGDVSNDNYLPGNVTLREAIALANALPGADTITFAAALTSGGPVEIDLFGGELLVSAAVDIVGPGADLLTVNGNFIDRVFHFTDGSLSTFFDATLSGLRIAGGGDVPTGAGIFSAENLSISDSVISGNMGANHGGGLYLRNGQHEILRSTVSGNMSNTSGGGIFHYNGYLTVRDSTISGNETGGDGGGINDVGGNGLLIINSTISNNTADFDGGGLNNFGGLVTIRHSTITDNEAINGVGGGIAAVNLSASTQINVYSSIVADNVGNDDVAVDNTGMNDSFDSLGYNVIGGGNAVAEFAATGDQTGVFNPGLGPLADNGGPTRTHALMSGSAAIDAGNPADEAGVGDVPEFDQRGSAFDRVSGALIDVGAFELQVQLPLLIGDYNENSVVDAADYTVWRDTLGQNVDNYSGADGSGNGIIDQDDFDTWVDHFGEIPMMGAGSGGQGVGSAEQLVALPAPAPLASAATPNQGGKAEGGRGKEVALAPGAVPFAASLSTNPTARVFAVQPRSDAAVSLSADTRTDAGLLAWLASGGSTRRGHNITQAERLANHTPSVETATAVRDTWDSVFESLELVGAIVGRAAHLP